MKTKQQLLATRKIIKAKKPNFLRQDSHKVRSLKTNWRAPKGIHSSEREKKHGYRRLPTIGWSSPKSVRGLTPEGYCLVIVANERQLADAKGPVMLAGTLGMKKRTALVKKAQELKIMILNVKNPEQYLQQVAAKMAKKKEEKKTRTGKKQKSAEEAKKKASEEKTEESKEEKEKREREEKKKVLEQR